MSYNSLFGLGTHSPDADLQGWWKLDDNAASTVVTDYSSGGNDGVASANTDTLQTGSGPPWQPSGFTFPSNALVTITDPLIIDGSSPFTICFWARAPLGSFADIYKGRANNNVTTRIRSDKVQHVLNILSTNDRVSSTSTLPDDTWEAVATSWGGVGGDIGSSVGGEPFNTLPTSGQCTNTGGLRLGTSAAVDSSNYSYFTRVLTSDELANVASGPEPINLTAPVLSQSTYTISTTDGTWDSQANGTINYTRSWEYADDAIGTNPVALNSTGSEIDATPEMDGKFIRVTVSASNDGGNDSAEDQATAWTAVTATSRGLGKEKAWWCPSLQDDSSNAIVGDLTVNGYDMNTVNMGSSNWVADTSEGGVRALEFNGTDEYCQTDLDNVPYSSLDAQLQTSVSAWVYGELTSGNGNPWAYAQTQSGVSTRRVGYRLADRGADQAAQCVFGSQNDDSNAQVKVQAANGSQPRSVWYHVYAEFEKTAVGGNQNASTRLWIDGVYIGEDSNTTNIFDNDPLHKMFLGQNTRATGNLETTYFDGRLDDIRFFGEHLTQNEITHLASARGVEGSPGGGGPTFQPAWAFQATVVSL